MMSLILAGPPSSTSRTSGNSTTNNKFQKIDGCCGADRISILPKVVITNILSRLSTKAAARTSLLSKSWRYSWTSIYNIDINDGRYLKKTTCKSSFLNFLERLLLLSHNIRTFHLTSIHNHDLNRMEACLSAVLRHNIESLKVTYSYKGITLPIGLLNCTSLKLLELKLPCCLKVTSTSFFYSNLTTLFLEGVEILNECYNSDHLVLTFSVLEVIKLQNIRWLNVKFVEIYAPRLTRLFIGSSSIIRSLIYSSDSDSDDLEDFDLDDSDSDHSESDDLHLPEEIVVKGSQVVHASIKYYCKKYDLKLRKKIELHVLAMLKGLSSVQHLAISPYDLAMATQSQLGVPILKFDALEKLEIGSSCNVETLVMFLQAAPLLKFLVIKTKYFDVYDYEEIEVVPTCIATHLEEVKFENVSGEKPLLDLVRFLLGNATQLKKIYISSSQLSDNFIEGLYRAPKASASLTIIVDRKIHSCDCP